MKPGEKPAGEKEERGKVFHSSSCRFASRDGERKGKGG